jgi:hypothetical protein
MAHLQLLFLRTSDNSTLLCDKLGIAITVPDHIIIRGQQNAVIGPSGRSGKSRNVSIGRIPRKISLAESVIPHQVNAP